MEWENQQKTIEERILAYSKAQNLFTPGQRILVAVSGGPDSVALLHLLVGLREQLPLCLGVAHVQHGLRPEAEEEAQFVRSLCEGLDLPFYLGRCEVRQRAQDCGLGIEGAARALRYEFFEQVMEEQGYEGCALAHHRDDQAETFLLRLIRGAGLHGLTGMKPRRGPYLRPLLFLGREELLQWLENQGRSFCLDASNEDPQYLRNRVRHEVLPLLEALNPSVGAHLARLCEKLSLDSQYLEDEALRAAQKFLSASPEGILIEKEAFELPEALQVRVAFLACEALLGDREALSEGHIKQILDLARGTTGRRVNLARNVRATARYGAVLVSHSIPHTPPPFEEKERDGTLPRLYLQGEEGRGRLGDYQITWSLSEPDGPYERLDWSGLSPQAFFRTRRPKDRIRVLGMQGHKKVKSLFIDRKIPRDLRDGLPILVTEQGDLAYIYPGILAQAFRITPNTDKILYITVTKGEHHDAKYP
ncbi:tRNA(Ile)-lysidine synthetase [Clostridiaceae bacterium JG1575]|nr:tRNA(Ile)-lysidine synthetase [Clostridiaceae bacterium JG1575]